MSSKQATVLSTSVICKQPGRYIGWPTVGRMPNGELLAVFSGDRDAHVDPFGKTQLVRSADNGATWSPPTTINDTPLDDRDAGICVCRDGTVIVSWFTSHYTDEKYMQMCRDNREEIGRRSAYLKAFDSADLVRWAGTELEDGRYRLGHWIRRSTDGARSWETPVRVPPTTPHGPIELDDGRLLFVGIETNHGRRERRGHLLAAESCDRGTTWRVIGTITMFPPYPGDAPGGYAYFCEPHVTEASPGKLVAMARYEELPRASERSRLWQFDSDDGGHTWTEPRELPILGKPPHLLTLHDGRLLLTYGYRHPPSGSAPASRATGDAPGTTTGKSSCLTTPPAAIWAIPPQSSLPTAASTRCSTSRTSPAKKPA